MNFFEHQQQARRNSSVLVFLFVVAVIAIVVAVDAATLVGYQVAQGYSGLETASDPSGGILFIATIGTLLVILFGSLFRIRQLASGGGAAVAELMGAVPIQPNTTDVDEKRLINVVEEMSIASGCNVPGVWVMKDELNINAFAAGYVPSEAAVVVSAGCLRKLTRAELQGVVAHEFSHIFNGDMRMNVRMLGVLNGILIIGLTGYGILRTLSYSGRSSRRSSKDNTGAIIAALFVFAILILAIGYIGVFFGRLIKASLSRSREFLADASAVQFTRDPRGIAGALKKIHDLGGSRMASAETEQLSHFFFSDAVGFHMPFFATHPGLEDRLTRILPDWQTTLPKTESTAPPLRSAEQVLDEMEAKSKTSASQLRNSVGMAGVAQLQQAHDLLDAIPEIITNLSRLPQGAETILFALIAIEHEKAPLALLKEVLRDTQDPRIVETAHTSLRQLGQATWLPIASLCIRTLQQLKPEAREQTIERARKLAEADGHTSPFEGAVLALLDRSFAPPREKRRVHGTRVEQVRNEVVSICAVLARAGAGDLSSARNAFDRGMAYVGFSGVQYDQVSKVNLALLPHYLKPLAEVTPLVKQKVLGALTEVAVSDGQVSASEVELLRTVAVALECPLPMLDRSATSEAGARGLS